MRRLPGALGALALAVPLSLLRPSPAAAQQDTTHPQDKIRIVGTYQPGTRPGLVVVPGPGLDSARAIIRRDLDFSDRFEVVVLPDGASPSDGARSGAEAASGLNYGLYRSFGASYALELAPDPAGTVVRLHDLASSKPINQLTAALPGPTDPGFRMAVHRLADEVVRWVTGTPGIAATQLVYVMDKRLYRVDSDGYNVTPITPANTVALSPAWSPDGRTIAYYRLGEGRGPLMLLDVASGNQTPLAGTSTGTNFAPAFSPDGRSLAYTHSDENGSDIFVASLAGGGTPQRLTVGRYADNLSPTYSPDGRRIAFVSTRAGPPQIYSMSADGTDQSLLVPFDFGATGPSNAPEWSPDGATVAFHREVSGSPQIFLYDVASRRVKQLTSSGRNEDPTWAPDGRHVAFISDRSGRRQIWIIDTETSRVRQLQAPGAARLPAWSRRLR
jgi:TolB protein